MEGNRPDFRPDSVHHHIPRFHPEPCVCPQVLVYDRFGQDIISPLLSVKELRDMGITLHL